MKKLIFIALITGSLLNASCKKDPADAPAIQPQSSLNVDFLDFQEVGKLIRLQQDKDDIGVGQLRM
jgi:hypothetical protein